MGVKAKKLTRFMLVCGTSYDARLRLWIQHWILSRLSIDRRGLRWIRREGLLHDPIPIPEKTIDDPMTGNTRTLHSNVVIPNPVDQRNGIANADTRQLMKNHPRKFHQGTARYRGPGISSEYVQ